ncbi:glycosyltransferase [Klenkia taihuensis]|uniref:Glycosyltransferase involved in cell wall bisynthesis n=1 Tax=Klenkia taihuensis TaxID=1225127 RepID=A0A1I1JYK9_9ACTN|nr:glycosyltransferase [Klenkia taihuensis]GHE10626.1 glycosyl transferase [Klenkia taihuensis]SFC53576.1 Glycosyltransferase involved in cell wall bisynthesis [Klenkia taihuensis]
MSALDLPTPQHGGPLFTVTTEPRLFSPLDERETRLLAGALTYQTLVHPGVDVRVTVTRANGPTPPSLTDQATQRVEWPDHREVVGTLGVRSTGQDPTTTTTKDVVVDLGGPVDQLSGLVRLPGRLNDVRNAIRARAPVAFDALRQRQTDRLENRRLSRPLPRIGAFERPEHTGASGQPPAVLFGMHWLELGGAERWAAETVRMARDAGLQPIVVTDRESAHPDIVSDVFDGALVIPLTHPMTSDDESTLLRTLFDRYDIRGVHVHHCTWLYQRLPWIRAQFPGTQLVDSLHVLEWRTGGFVDIALRLSNVIDEHHVISPQLRDYLVDRQNLSKTKVTLATLADLTVPAAEEPPAADHVDGPLTVAFVGRFTQQKRPYLFLRLARTLHRRLGNRVRFVMHGDGELGDEIRRDHARLGLQSVVEMRTPATPVSQTLEEADVLVICSDNEGVTLTSFEADAHGVLVVSADVGSQASVVVDDLLVPRHPGPLLARTADLVAGLVEDPARLASLRSAQHAKVAAFAALPRARDWTRDLYERWNS